MENKMTFYPPKQASIKKKNFINEPEDKIKETVDQKSPIWDGLNSEIIKTFNIRFTLPEKVKAEHIVKNSIKYSSLHDFCKKAIMEKIKIELETMIRDHDTI